MDIDYKINRKPPKITNLDKLKELSSTGLLVGILGTIGGALAFVFGIYLISTVYGKDSSPVGIIALYGLVIAFLGVIPFFVGISALIPSIVCKKFLKNQDIRYLKVSKIVSVVELILIALAFVSMVIYWIFVNHDEFISSLMVGGIIYIECGIPMSILPIMYIYRISKIVKELKSNE